MNNLNFATLNKKAMEMVDIVMSEPPYCELDGLGAMSTRTALLP